MPMPFQNAQSDGAATLRRLRQRLIEARQHTDALFEALVADALYQRPVAERHRLIFYVGHLEAFDGNLLAARLGLRPAVRPEFDRLFAFGIDPLGGGLPQDSPADWPAVAEIGAYRQALRRQIDDGLMASGLGGAGLEELLQIAIEHRLMHAETLAYLFNRLPLHLLKPPPDALPVDDPVRPGTAEGAGRLVPVPAGPVILGRPRDDAGGFGWDNEFPARRLEVPAFTIERCMVSNGRFLQFVEAGGYDDARFWAAEDWAWRVAQRIEHPSFWRHDGRRWWLRTIWREQPLPLAGPVYVSHAEASAYAAWAGLALPTEAQWQRAAQGAPTVGSSPASGSGEPRAAEPTGRPQVNADFRRWEPRDVDSAAELSQLSDWGVAGLYGNGWEWTCSPFAPNDGFEASPAYPGYSRDFFDGRHFVLKGGSMRTAACMLRPSFRNWFQPHYPHVYAGLRCVGPALAPGH